MLSKRSRVAAAGVGSKVVISLRTPNASTKDQVWHCCQAMKAAGDSDAEECTVAAETGFGAIVRIKFFGNDQARGIFHLFYVSAKKNYEEGLIHRYFFSVSGVVINPLCLPCRSTPIDFSYCSLAVHHIDQYESCNSFFYHAVTCCNDAPFRNWIVLL